MPGGGGGGGCIVRMIWSAKVVCRGEAKETDGKLDIWKQHCTIGLDSGGGAHPLRNKNAPRRGGEERGGQAKERKKRALSHPGRPLGHLVKIRMRGPAARGAAAAACRMERKGQ
uniref:Uncharacterized protein n=1 Tax=Rhizochromulina marina TaxID=1034831 RepID=A0A7S2W8I5_9STRA|mmetsp:Transcript_17466/g.51045  ORF Transcript_17466/g.51045 Transcript_17466/m.51045 type:complete len:114 (+) Transcript_17466:428-769(+)|eukprot:CAMPEP_0118970478 /NCGR_PEP_ID=MMETSP1173-20130426/7370_1 /TAXON_ID=1034831 /ORGANISM="Rhizochromulina marina cf, Strain CCMP1243" /LENGTH=113 /DNA_ID=CAMNT_0006919849 /DNA_START=427 /DNA_END=765 /DNA_ORIENTATION=-